MQSSLTTFGFKFDSFYAATEDEHQSWTVLHPDQSSFFYDTASYPTKLKSMSDSEFVQLRSKHTVIGLNFDPIFLKSISVLTDKVDSFRAQLYADDQVIFESDLQEAKNKNIGMKTL